jgi:hypothetical protein
VFQRRPREARKALTALCSDIGITILLSALDRRDIVTLPELPDLPAGDGADPTWARLTTPQQNAWLRIGAECEAAAGLTASFEQMAQSCGPPAQIARYG